MNIREKNFDYEDRYVVHADLVPKVSNKVMAASMKGDRVGGMQTGIVERSPTMRMVKRDMSHLVAPIRRGPMRQRPILQVMPPRPAFVPQQAVAPQPVQTAAPATTMPAPQGQVTLTQDYGKIMPLLDDPSVSNIECPGPDKPLFVVRVGQRQITKITLNPLEIRALLEKFAEAAHIPLLEGVFRVTVDGMNVSAVISEMLGSKFVIRKATPYGLLE
ncbi:hypothetical protein HNV12_02370 [Methanococcoides sp. SA1]|nr:hypothetical protein [Methanococcoides sp. SA1]